MKKREKKERSFKRKNYFLEKGGYFPYSNVAFMPGWRNGRRRGLKIPRSQGRAGSTPALGTILHKDIFTMSLCSFVLERSRTPEAIFRALKIGEAVPRARERDGANETRGRLPPWALKKGARHPSELLYLRF